MTPLAAGLLLGVAGSVHCVAMCGPLVLAVRHARDGLGSAIYHGARIAMYAALGLLAGIAGHAVSVAGLGRALSVGAGVSLIAIAVMRTRGGRGVTLGAGVRAAGMLARAMQAARAHTLGRPRAGAMAAGALNALLPCGLVYAALAAATATATPAGASSFMLAFGLGTVPALAVLPLLARILPQAARSRLRLATPAALAVVGGMLIMRGMH